MVRGNIVEDDEFHEPFILSVVHFAKNIYHHGFGDIYYFNLIRSATQTCVSMCKGLLMKYYGDNVYMTCHKMKDIPKIW